MEGREDNEIKKEGNKRVLMRSFLWLWVKKKQNSIFKIVYKHSVFHSEYWFLSYNPLNLIEFVFE
jgi:hypothetical protein